MLASDAGPRGEFTFLTAGEIATSTLEARLAVLSACQTAEGQSSLGEGLLGFSWAFRAAGCESVLASLWDVEDSATRSLMVAFYQGLKAGKPKDVALQNAVKSLKSKPGQRSPLFWAPFQLIGDPTPLPSFAVTEKN